MGWLIPRMFPPDPRNNFTTRRFFRDGRMAGLEMIGRQLLEGLQVLHGYHLAYRDLKPAKTFFARYAPDWWIKLGDFGIVRRICTEHNSKLSRIGTFDYMALEILEEQNMSYTLAVDIWSLGYVLFRLLTQQLPFSY